MRRMLSAIGLLVMLALSVFTQNSIKYYQTFDFATKMVSRSELAKLGLEDLQKLRGIVFGKHGRIFVEKNIQEFLSKQSWYKPSKDFNNSVLNANERKNIDLIREEEAVKHDTVEPGDLRFWVKKEIPDEKVYSNSAADWSVLIAEFEAIHGKTFSEDWLQKYFDARYWYKQNPNYTPGMLSEIERKNLEKFVAKRNEDRKVAISSGDMDKFQNVSLTEELLKGLNFNELRILRNEIFARRGKKFTVAAYRQEFESQPWYKPLKDQSKVVLNPIEEANVKLLQDYESRLREKITTEELPEDFVSGMYAEDLRILRNEIFAKHGRIFKDIRLQKYFEAQPWYKSNPDYTDESASKILSVVEIKNVATIKAEELVAFSKFVMVEG